MLMDWKEQDSTEPNLKKLLAFLVAVSKQLNLVHVILATSDYFLASWLKGSKCFHCLNSFRALPNQQLILIVLIWFCRGIGYKQLQDPCPRGSD